MSRPRVVIMEKASLEKLKRIRKYSSFFECLDKQMKERNIVDYLLYSMQLDGLGEFSNPRPAPNPPDCVVSDVNGNEVGVEVTEFVSEKAIRRNQKGQNVYRNWQPAEVLAEVNALVAEKDAKPFQGGPYKYKILVIFTDEIILSARQEGYAEILSKHSFGPVSQLDDAYFLFSYDGIDRCPYVRLRL
jgi:hypothetical protein